MTDLAAPADAPAAGPVVPDGLTPTGLQSEAVLGRRRRLMFALNFATVAVLAAGIVRVFGAGGWSPADVVILVCFLLGTPWMVMGFWNALAGLWLLHGRKDGLSLAAPHLAAGETDAPIRARVALLMFLRNEDPERALSRLAITKRSLDETGEGARFDVFVLSDSDDPETVAAEPFAFERWRAALGAGARFRRREKNTAWKAGNVRDFLDRWGDGYDFYLPLDSDSLMGGRDVLRMVRIMEAHPKIGILQSLIVGAPAESAFARIFQFGMRSGMRSFTMGAAWWHGDCGPYWGHNALIRTAPFKAHCELPKLPGTGPLGGHVLSHDQIEAVLMRRAGFEVRVLPVEGESWEDNPPTLFEFTRRDLRWCQGNMQYWPFLAMKGLKPMSRFQVLAAIMMYFGAPAWMFMTAAAVSKVWETETGTGTVSAALGIAMFFIMFTVSLFPKLAGWIDVALRPGGARAYGGGGRMFVGALTETVFATMLAPIVAFRVTMFLIGLLFGKRMAWNGQLRDAHRLSWGTALRGLWPQTAFGLAILGVLYVEAPGAIAWASPMLAGLLLSIPFAVLTSHPAFGRFAQRAGLCAIPDEYAPGAPLRVLAAPSAPGTPRAA